MDSIQSLLANATPEQKLKLAHLTLTTRYITRSAEVLHRVVTARITILVVSLAVAGGVFQLGNAWVLLGGVLLVMVLGGVWLQNDRRIGEGADELEEIELQLKLFDGLEGFLRRRDFTSWTMRVFFPGVQNLRQRPVHPDRPAADGRVTNTGGAAPPLLCTQLE